MSARIMPRRDLVSLCRAAVLHIAALIVVTATEAVGRAELARRLSALDPRDLTTYYAVDAVNFTPADLSSALDTLDAVHLPLMVQEATGVSLDPGFSKQKEILERCLGQFYRCADGAEARRFNRLLIDAGSVKRL
jgi:hypothetical protein